ncbi:MAG: urease accessory protein, partial [Cyclobacteriaceae bacterium]
VALGIFRITKTRTKAIPKDEPHASGTKLAYSIGLLHGLAGSGAVILIALSEIQSSSLSIIYLLLFGSGSILGMMIIAALFKIPLSSKAGISTRLQKGFMVLSGLLCIGYGVYMIYSFLQ